MASIPTLKKMQLLSLILAILTVFNVGSLALSLRTNSVLSTQLDLCLAARTFRQPGIYVKPGGKDVSTRMRLGLTF